LKSSQSRLAVWRNPNFRLFVSSRFLSSTAIWMQSVAVGWQVYAKTGHVTDLGYVGLAQFLPFFAFILLSGQVADRHDRLRILTVCNGGYVAGSLLLLTYTMSGATSVLPIFGILLLLGTSRAFAMPANQAILRNIVAPEEFRQAVAFNSTAFHVAVVVGPVLGGFVYLAGPAAVHATVCICLVVATLMLLPVRTHQTREANTPITWRTTLEGFRFVRSRPVILGAISLDLFAVLFGGAVAMLPALGLDGLAGVGVPGGVGAGCAPHPPWGHPSPRCCWLRTPRSTAWEPGCSLESPSSGFPPSPSGSRTTRDCPWPACSSWEWET